MKHLPEKIAELIVDKSFGNLSDHEKELLSNVMNKQEYNEMQSVYQLLDSISIPKNTATDVMNQKASIIFDNHQPKVVSLWRQAIPIWQAACAACFILVLWLVHWQKYMASSPVNNTRIDTVYIEKEIPVKVYDTVYIQQTSIESKQKPEKEYSSVSTQKDTRVVLITMMQRKQEQELKRCFNTTDDYRWV